MSESNSPSADSSSVRPPQEPSTLVPLSSTTPIDGATNGADSISPAVGNDDGPFLERVMRYLEDDLDKQEVLKLGHELAEDPAKRDAFLLVSLSDAMSHSELGAGGIVLSKDHSVPTEPTVPSEEDPNRPDVMVVRDLVVLSTGKITSLTKNPTVPDGAIERVDATPAHPVRSVGPIIAILLCGLAIAWIVGSRLFGPRPDTNVSPAPAIAPPINRPGPELAPGSVRVATFVSGHRLRWSDAPLDAGSQLSNDVALHVLDGLSLVAFPNGTKVILQGQCDFAPHDSSSAMLRFGRLTVLGARQASFTMNAGKVSVTTTGGAFGMTVDSDGVVEVHVLGGSLTLGTIDGQSAAPVTLNTGMAARGQASGGSFRTFIGSPAEFATALPSPPAATSIEATASRQAADRYFDNSDFRNALVFYRDLIREDPSQTPDVANRLGTLYAWSGDYESAARQLELAARPADSDRMFLYRAACLRALIGSGQRYRDDCRQLLARTRDSTERSALEITAKTCLLYPGSVEDMSAVYELASRALADEKPDENLKWYRMTAALAEYRKGNDQTALGLLHKSEGQFDYNNQNYALTLLMAACEFRMKAPTATATLARARADLAVGGPNPAPTSGVENWCIGKVLEAEVRALVGPARWAAAAPPSPPDPIAAYKFDDSSPTVVADSGQHPPANGAIHGKFRRIQGPPGIGYALEFEGQDSWVEIGNPAKLNFEGTITMTAWVRPDDLSDGIRSIIDHGPITTPGGTETYLRLRSSAYEAGSWTMKGDYRARSPVREAGRWTFVAGTYDGRFWRLYSDGIIVAESPVPVGAIKVSGNWYIGASADSTSRRAFNGAIAAVRIYNVALTGDQIAALANPKNR